MSSRGNKRGRTNPSSSRPARQQVPVDAPPARPRPFSTVQASDIFDEHYHNQAIVSELGVNLETLPPHVRGDINWRNWQSLCVLPVRYPNTTLIREFYSNLHVARANRDSIYVRGVMLDISAAAINRYFGLPSIALDDDYLATIQNAAAVRNGMDQHEYCRRMLFRRVQWRASKSDQMGDIQCSLLDDVSWFYIRFMLRNLNPLDQNSALKKPQLLLLFGVMTHDVQVDVGRVIYSWMQDMRENMKRGIPFPYLITELARTAGVPFYDDDAYEDVHPHLLEFVSPFSRTGRRPDYHAIRQGSSEELDLEMEDEGEEVPQSPVAPVHDTTDHWSNMYMALADQRDWAEDARLERMTQRSMLTDMMAHFNLDTTGYGYQSGGPYEYRAALHDFIPPRPSDAPGPSGHGAGSDDTYFPDA